MWWINKFGSVSGPYSDEQIQKGIKGNLFTRLHKISSDRQAWRRLDQTEFWNPESSAPERMEIPEFSVGKIGSISRPKPKDERAEIVDEVTILDESMALERNQDLKRVGFKAKLLLMMISGLIAVGVAVLSVVVLWNRGTFQPKPQINDKTTQKTLPSTKVKTNAVNSANDFNFIKKSVVIVRTREGANGTAFLVKMGGKKYILTNDHVIRSKFAPEMVLVDGTKLNPGNLSIASDRDLARFEIDHDGAFLELSEELPNNNDEIWVYGNSMGDGVITTLRGFVTGIGSKVVKINAEIVNGNSGSPILAKDGKVVAVASYLRNGDNGKDWTTKGTAFDNVRRFGIRANNAEWVAVDMQKYGQDCARIELMEVYWEYLRPYLICQNVSDEQYKTLKLEHKDVDKKSFGTDDAGFHEMLMALSKSYSGQGGSWRKWHALVHERDALIKRLNEAIKSNEVTLENGKNALAEFDKRKDIGAVWENVKIKHRDFNAKRKEALIMARDFLSNDTWADPLMKRGYSSDDNVESVDWYLKAIQFFLDQNAQALKDLNKALKNLENGDGDEE